MFIIHRYFIVFPCRNRACPHIEPLNIPQGFFVLKRCETRNVFVIYHHQINKETMKDFNQLIKRMQDLGEEKTYTEAERKRLQNVFKDGKLSKNICWAGWVEYTDNKGKTHYTKYFSNEVENLMEQLCNERIANVEQSLKALYEDFSLEKCVRYINTYIKEIANMEVNSYEWQRLIKNAKESVASVENGKLNKENGNTYDCIVIRHRNFYAASMVINKTENGYKIEERMPLCGDSNYKTDIYGLFKCLKQFTRDAIY